MTLNSRGKELEVGGPTCVSLSVRTGDPEEFFHWRTGVVRTPSATVAVHSSWYICPAISLPAVLIETASDEGGTTGKTKSEVKYVHWCHKELRCSIGGMNNICSEVEYAN